MYYLLSRNLYLYFAFVIMFSLITIISSEYIITSDIFYNSYSNQLTLDQINSLLFYKERYGWISYTLTIIGFTLKINFAAFCIFIGVFFTNQKVKYKSILKIVLLAEFVFVIYSAFRLLFLYLGDFETIEQIRYFQPLSLFSLFQPGSIPDWFIYPLSILNVAELIYWFLLALGLRYIFKSNYLKNLKTVLTSYGTGLLLWIVVFVFIQVYFLNPGV